VDDGTTWTSFALPSGSRLWQNSGGDIGTDQMYIFSNTTTAARST